MPEATTHPAGTPTWFDLSTGKPEEAKAFYTALFGWEFEDYGPELGHYHRARKDGEEIAGMVPQSPQMPDMPSAWSVYFASDDAHADAARIRELGGSVLVEPMQVMNLGHMMVATDPTGAVFGLWQPIDFHGYTVAAEHGAPAWQEVLTRDSGKARDFYTTLFHSTAQAVPGGLTYYTLKQGDTETAGIMQMDEGHWPASVPPHWMTYFAVDDVQQALKTAEEHGGRVNVPPFASPFGTIAILADPDGAVFSVIQLSQPA
ncbi:VOC family protein [Deinococcus sp. KSM4-11]|uniref:VOC family protein n=1 Tax=Deinococcus sp. KSM4-11 TaxID=2568654 RepID=UPI001454BC2B|nr:VOC family protein [Deinococcus sp. KSM4-11]